MKNMHRCIAMDKNINLFLFYNQTESINKKMSRRIKIISIFIGIIIILFSVKEIYRWNNIKSM